MKEREDELFEAELGRLKPARLPAELQARLDARPLLSSQDLEAQAALTPAKTGHVHWRLWLRWLAPSAGAAVLSLVLLVVISRSRQPRNTPAPPAWASVPTLKVDQVEIDRQLLGSFDAVAEMPDGEPVRFRFQQWMDAVTLRDSVRGVEVVRRSPRIEVVPVSFASY
jgi:hypothetical protein